MLFSALSMCKQSELRYQPVYTSYIIQYLIFFGKSSKRLLPLKFNDDM